MVKHHQSHTKKSVTLKIFGTEISVTLPAEVCTTVGEVKELVATEALVDADKLVFYSKSGAYISALKDVDQIATTTYVKGIKSFKPQAMEWPNPIGIIGCGYHGLKTAMTYSMDGNENYVMFDRFDMVGGYCWITGANKTSRLQTEFGSFHVWWGQECVNTGKFSYPNCNEITLTNPVESVAKEINMGRDGWSIWPYKWEIQAHFKLAAEKFGLLPHIRFKSNVAAMSIVGAKDAESRYYELVVDSLAGKPTEKVPVSVIYNYPGSLTQNRIIEYPGEDLFDGEIRYGMNDDTPYEKLKGSTIAILGNGAFAVENARTCLECEGVKAYIVTRRKNLASPRIPCWFVHQGPIPTPGGFVLKTFEPMYKLVDFGDPWEFWSVHSNAARTNVSIIQNSRFGIGDVTFLMVAWGLLEYVVATVKRFSRHTLHLSTGDKLEDVQICLKALGLLGDYAVDRLHNMKDMPLSELELIAFESSDRTMPELNVKEYIVHEGAVNYTYNQGSFQTWINEIELELSSNRPKASRKSKIALALLEGLALPAFFGADRCYMGQVAIGIIKGITLGGLGIWAFIDYLVIFINMLKMNESINCFGFSGEFRPDDIEPAFEISVVLVIFTVFLIVVEQTKRDRSFL